MRAAPAGRRARAVTAVGAEYGASWRTGAMTARSGGVPRGRARRRARGRRTGRGPHALPIWYLYETARCSSASTARRARPSCCAPRAGDAHRAVRDRAVQVRERRRSGRARAPCTTTSRWRRVSRAELGAWYVETIRDAESSPSACGPSTGARSTSPSCSDAARACRARDASVRPWLNRACASLRRSATSRLVAVASWSSRRRRRREPDQPEQPADAARGRGQRRRADVATRERRAELHRRARSRPEPGAHLRDGARGQRSRSAPTSATGRCRDEVKFANQANQPGNNPACVATVGTSANGTPVGHSYHGWGKAVDLTDAGQSLTFASPGLRVHEAGRGLARLEPSRVRGAGRQHVPRAVALGVGRRRRQPRRVAACAATRSRCCRAPTTAATRSSTVSAASRAHGDFVNRGSAASIPIAWVMVGAADTRDRGGYWMVGADGGVFSFGDAHFYGSTGGIQLAQPVNGIAPTRSGHGYWLLAWDGGVFSFGDARLLRFDRRDAPEPPGRRHGADAERQRLLARRERRRRVQLRRRALLRFDGRPAHSNSPIVGIAPTPTRQGLLDGRVRRRRVHASATRTSTARSPRSGPPSPTVGIVADARPATATGSSSPTARCSASATRTPDRVDRRLLSDSVARTTGRRRGPCSKYVGTCSNTKPGSSCSSPGAKWSSTASTPMRATARASVAPGHTCVP